MSTTRKARLTPTQAQVLRYLLPAYNSNGYEFSFMFKASLMPSLRKLEHLRLLTMTTASGNFVGTAYEVRLTELGAQVATAVAGK